jgi:hypothetical protein
MAMCLHGLYGSQGYAGQVFECLFRHTIIGDLKEIVILAGDNNGHGIALLTQQHQQAMFMQSLAIFVAHRLTILKAKASLSNMMIFPKQKPISLRSLVDSMQLMH